MIKPPNVLAIVASCTFCLHSFRNKYVDAYSLKTILDPILQFAVSHHVNFWHTIATQIVRRKKYVPAGYRQIKGDADPRRFYQPGSRAYANLNTAESVCVMRGTISEG